MPMSFVIPSIPSAHRISNASRVGLCHNYMDPSPEEEDHPAPFSTPPSRFRILALTIQACLRFRWTMRIKARLLRGTPSSRLRSCVHVMTSITRLRTTLPDRRARRKKFLLPPVRYSTSLPNKHMLHAFRSYGYAIIFSHILMHILHERHLQCLPLETSLDIISEALNIKLDQAFNSGKCKVLLQVFSSISSQLTIMRFVLANLKNPLDLAAFKGLSACYYSLKELCRLLSVCKQYIQDCTSGRSLARHKVFAKLENVHTIKFLLLDLYKCQQILVKKFEGFVNSICACEPVAQEFTWEFSPPCLPGSFMGHYLQLQAKIDLSHVLADLEQYPRSFWSTFRDTLLNAAEDNALRKLLIARLNFPIAGQGEVEYLKKGMFVDKKHITKVRHLGAGSYGKVEEVLCFGEKYAMKTIKGPHTVEGTNEAVLQATLQHPNIVKLMWYTLNFDSQDSLCLLMDLMTTSLEDYIAQQAYCTPSRLFNYPLVSVNIMMQIATAMRYLHRQGIMHRDLKAANVLVGGSWSPDPFNEGYVHVKVADFGVAKVKHVGSRNTWGMGTAYWRAPEVVAGEPPSSSDGLTSRGTAENLGFRNHIPNYSLPADVYSFAMTCYEIVSGKKPFHDLLESGMNQRELKERIEKKDERPSLPASLHPGLRDLIEQCWDGRPESRPSFEAICAKLDQIRDDYAFASRRQRRIRKIGEIYEELDRNVESSEDKGKDKACMKRRPQRPESCYL